jgi:hypothetical protein
MIVVKRTDAWMKLDSRSVLGGHKFDDSQTVHILYLLRKASDMSTHVCVMSKDVLCVMSKDLLAVQAQRSLENSLLCDQAHLALHVLTACICIYVRTGTFKLPHTHTSVLSEGEFCV